MRRSPVMLWIGVLVAVGLVSPAGAQQAVERVAGADRYGTAAAVSVAAFPDGADVAWVATGEDFPDALAAGAAAASGGGPVLLAARSALPEATQAELRRLAPDRIVLVGGEAAVDARVEAALRPLAPQGLTRIAGPDRYATAAAVAQTHPPAGGDGVVHVATGAGFADALGAAALGEPVLLVTADGVPAATREALGRLEPGEVVVLGGEAAVPAAVVAELEAAAGVAVRRVAGADRYATAAALAAEAFPGTAPVAVLASGARFADALAGAPAAAVNGGPVLLAQPDCVPGPVRAEIARLAPARVLLLGGPGAVAPAVERLAGCGVGTTVLADGLTEPWEIAFAPDGRAFLTERPTGRLLVRDATGAITEVQRLAVDAEGEGGLLGLAVSPDFADDGLLYAYLTTPEDNRIVRFRPGEAPEPIFTGIPSARIHNGGRIGFGPDGKLYAGTGDAAEGELAQDPASLGGKVLRLEPDGSVPADNPDPASPVYARGFRNVQGLAWDAAGRLLITEFGADSDDEVNRVVPGGNHGWPLVTGVARREGLVDPIAVRQPPEASWSGATVLRGGAVAAWEGDLFAAALRGHRLWRLDLDAEGRVAGAETLLTNEFGRLRTAVQGPDGALYLLTDNGTDDLLIRLGPPS